MAGDDTVLVVAAERIKGSALARKLAVMAGQDIYRTTERKTQWPKRVVLAYSGGLDTSVAVRWMTEEMGVEVIALAADLGQGGDWDAVTDRALAAGAVEVVVVDVQKEFGTDFVAPAIRANALYEGKYPLISSLSRPVIVKHLVAAARQHGADAIAHGCTGKGNDQVRFEVSTRALAPDLEVIAPVRTWGFTRDDSIDYAKRWGIPISATKASPYSVDQNLWGRTVECGILEDPWVMPPADVYELTVPKAAGGEPVEVVVTFEAGLPVALDGRPLTVHELVPALDAVVGPYGFGRIDMIENRRVGIKSREIYECPGALALLMAHGPRRHDPRARRRPRKSTAGTPLGRARLRRPLVLAAENGPRCLLRRVPAPCDRRGPPALRARDGSRGLGAASSPAAGARSPSTTTTWPPTRRRTVSATRTPRALCVSSGSASRPGRASRAEPSGPRPARLASGSPGSPGSPG